MTMTREEIIRRSEEDLFFYAQLVNPAYMYGDIHKEVFRWLGDPNCSTDQLLLLPRGHLKSHMLATWTAWWVMKNPSTTILYLSATEDLATQQLYAIKNILTSDIHMSFWPKLIMPNEADREEWNFKNIKIDHPIRKEQGVRDRTIAARSVGAGTTGLHADVLVFDDLVVPENAYTEEGRNKVAASYSQFSSIANTGAISKVAGTRYHGRDIYNQMLETTVEQFDDDGNVVDEKDMYEVMERVVERDNIFLWPRTQNPKTGKWYGFNWPELAKIRAKYFASGERAQYHAQYYNNPNDPDEEGLDSDDFIYYDREHLQFENGKWSFRGKELTVFAGGDLAYTEGPKSDYTAFAVVGLDSEGFIYLLDLDQFKTTKYEKMYQAIEKLHRKWRFKRIRLETNAGANLIAEYVKDRIREEGGSLVVDGKPSKGDKLERFGATVLPRYENSTILHFRGGFINTYEDQVLLSRPSHDDLRDAVGAAIEISKPPMKQRHRKQSRGSVITFDKRFGGRLR